MLRNALFHCELSPCELATGSWAKENNGKYSKKIENNITIIKNKKKKKINPIIIHYNTLINIKIIDINIILCIKHL